MLRREDPPRKRKYVMTEKDLGKLSNVGSGLLSVLNQIGPLLVPKKLVDFNFSAAKAYRVIGALITTIGVQALGIGVAFLVIGNMGKARYERLTGRFVRTFSDEDIGLYEQAALLSNVSWAFLIVGALMAILGIGVLPRFHGRLS